MSSVDVDALDVAAAIGEMADMYGRWDWKKANNHCVTGTAGTRKIDRAA